MRIEMKREAELAKRKGLAGRTAVALIGMAVTFALAYMVAIILFSREIITPGFFYDELSVPAEVSEWMIQLAVVFIIFCGFQLIMMLIFAVFSPEARTRSGKPTTAAKDLDYFDKHYNYQAQADYSEEEYTYTASDPAHTAGTNGITKQEQDIFDEWQPEEWAPEEHQAENYQPEEYGLYEQEYESFGKNYRRDDLG